MKFVFTLIAFFFLFLHNALAQATGPVYRQFLFNPYTFNSGYVGINDKFEANLIYRQQWAGFRDAPAAAGFNLQLPVKSRVAVGFNFTTDRQVMLRTSTALTTFGYIVPVSENQSLRFGLSGGVGWNSLDLTADELNTTDPAISNASTQNFYLDGNFGVVYTFSKLRLGFALTSLFKSKSFNTESFGKIELSGLRNRLYSASYKFLLGPQKNFSVEPYVLYRQMETKKFNAWEGGAALNYKEHIWIGAAYNQRYGTSMFFGVSLKDRFRVGYSYDLSIADSKHVPGSHEFHLGIRLGQKKSTKLVIKPTASQSVLANQTKPVSPSPTGNKNPMRRGSSEPADVKLLEAPLPSVESKAAVNHPARRDSPGLKVPVAEKPKASEAFTTTKGHYYVVVSVFSVMSHSMKFSKEMMTKGYRVSVILNPKNNFYYVYLFSSLDEEEAKKVRNDYRRRNLFKEAWIFKME